MNGKVINVDHLRDCKWNSFYPCGYILLSLQHRHSNHKWAHAHLRHCSDPQLTYSDEVLLKSEELVQFIRTLLGVRWKRDVKRENRTGTSSKWMGTLTVLIQPLDWIFLLTPCRYRSCCRFLTGFLHGWTRTALKKAGKLLHFPNGVKIKWTHFSCWIILGFAWGT